MFFGCFVCFIVEILQNTRKTPHTRKTSAQNTRKTPQNTFLPATKQPEFANTNRPSPDSFISSFIPAY